MGSTRLFRFAPLLAVLILGACGTPKKAGPRSYTFFPPSPDEPRVQFLTSFSSDFDLGRNSDFVDFVTGRPVNPNPVNKPYGMALRDGILYVCDTGGAGLVGFDLTKKRARYVRPRGEGRLVMPINVGIDTDGTRYVADTGRNQVLILSKTDEFVGAIGAKDEMRPCDVALTSDRLYVADPAGHAVRVYGKADQRLLFTIPRDTNDAKAKLFSPVNLAVDNQNRLLVSDLGAFSIQVYDLEGNYLRRIGQQGVAPGLFARPKGVAVDREGIAYVVDAATQVVQMFDKEGRLLMFFGQPGASTLGELYLPAGVEVDYDNVGLFKNLVAPGFDLDHLILVSSQYGYNKISVYGFLRKK